MLIAAVVLALAAVALQTRGEDSTAGSAATSGPGTDPSPDAGPTTPSPSDAEPAAAVDVVVEDQQDETIDVGDVLSDRRFEWSGAEDGAAFRRTVPVRVVVRDSSGIVVDVGDVVSDDVFVRTVGESAAPGRRLSLRIPVEIRVERSTDVRVEVEDVFGDNVAVWSQGQVAIDNGDDGDDGGASNLTGARSATAPPDPGSGGATGPAVSVRIPVTIHVSESADVVVDVEDIFGDNVVAWSSADAEVSNLLARLHAGTAAQPRATRAGGSFRLRIPVSITVEDSSSTTVNIEDIAGDDVLAAAGAEVRVSNLRGRRAATPDVARAVEVSVPVAIRVQRSTDVLVDIEDIVGDEVLSRSGGAADISNLTSAAEASATSFALRAPLRVDVVDSRRVEVEVEDIAGDVVVGAAAGRADISSLKSSLSDPQHGDPARVTPARPAGRRATMAVVTPATLTVTGSRDVTIDIEDIGGDDTFVASGTGVTVSELRGPGGSSTAVRQLRVRAAVRIEVVRSRVVDIDIEDVVGDTDTRLLGGNGVRVAALVDASLRAVVRGGRDVNLDVAALASGNSVVLCGSEGTRTELEDPGRYTTPCGTLTARADVRRSVTARASGVDLTVGRVFRGNALAAPGSSPTVSSSTVRTTSAVTAAPEPRYLGAQPEQPDGFRIEVQPGPRLAADPAALASVRRAAAQWERFLTDAITVTLAVDLADDLPAGVLAQAVSPDARLGYPVVREALIADARDELGAPAGFADALTLALPTVLRATLPDPVTLTGDVELAPANAKALGFADPNGARADATIVVATSAGDDLERAAAHEIGHALGFLSAVDDVNSGAVEVSPTPLDLYRFADGGPTDPRTAAEFAAFPRSYVPGRAANLDFVRETHAMATGEHNGRYPGTDGTQARHWKDPGTRGGAVSSEPVMHGRVGHLAVACPDLRALDLIGYEVAACPER